MSRRLLLPCFCSDDSRFICHSGFYTVGIVVVSLSYSEMMCWRVSVVWWCSSRYFCISGHAVAAGCNPFSLSSHCHVSSCVPHFSTRRARCPLASLAEALRSPSLTPVSICRCIKGATWNRFTHKMTIMSTEPEYSTLKIAVHWQKVYWFLGLFDAAHCQFPVPEPGALWLPGCQIRYRIYKIYHHTVKCRDDLPQTTTVFTVIIIP